MGSFPLSGGTHWFQALSLVGACPQALPTIEKLNDRVGKELEGIGPGIKKVK